MKTPHLKRISLRKKRKEETIMISISITQCLSIMIICLELPLTLSYPLAKLPTLIELIIINGCIAWKKYLYSISPKVWQVVCDGVEFSNEDEQLTADQLQKIHHNVQVISILTSSIDKEEFNRFDGLYVAKDVWNTLWMAYEESRSIMKAKVEILEGQLNRLIMYDDETPHEIFNRLKKLVNNARALGSKKWIDRILTERLMMTYTSMNYDVVGLIHQDLAYKMLFDDVLGRIMDHEMNIQETNNIKNLYKGVSTSKK
jgi:hypothetical protein